MTTYDIDMSDERPSKKARRVSSKWSAAPTRYSERLRVQTMCLLGMPQEVLETIFENLKFSDDLSLRATCSFTRNSIDFFHSRFLIPDSADKFSCQMRWLELAKVFVKRGLAVDREGRLLIYKQLRELVMGSGYKFSDADTIPLRKVYAVPMYVDSPAPTWVIHIGDKPLESGHHYECYEGKVLALSHEYGSPSEILRPSPPDISCKGVGGRDTNSTVYIYNGLPKVLKFIPLRNNRFCYEKSGVCPLCFDEERRERPDNFTITRR